MPARRSHFKPSAVNLTSEGEIDWVHWGFYKETSTDLGWWLKSRMR